MLRLALDDAVANAATGIPLETLRAQLGLPTTAVLRALLPVNPRLRLTPSGRVVDPETLDIPGHLVDARDLLAKRWATDPLDAPTAEELRDLALDNRALGQLHDLGAVLRLSDTVVVAPEAVSAALAVLRDLPAPFTVSDARSALGSSRRVTLPLLGHLDGVEGHDPRSRRPPARRMSVTGRWVLHDHRVPRPHFDLRLELDGVLVSWAVPRGLPSDVGRNRLAVAVPDHAIEHLDYVDEHKFIADTGLFELVERTPEKLVFTLVAAGDDRRLCADPHRRNLMAASPAQGAAVGQHAVAPQ